MPQGLSNVPATCNRLVTQLFRPHRGYAQTNFEDIFVVIRASNGRSILKNIIIICDSFLSACARINLMKARLNAFLAL